MTLTPTRSARLVVGVFAGWAALSAGVAHANTIPVDRVPTNDSLSFTFEAALSGQGDQATVQTQSTSPQTRAAEDIGTVLVSPEWFAANGYSAAGSEPLLRSRAGRLGIPIHGEGWYPRPTPEPASLILTGTGLVMLALRRRRRS